MIRRLGILVMVLVLASVAGACGRQGDPEHPEGSQYPRHYPARTS